MLLTVVTSQFFYELSKRSTPLWAANLFPFQKAASGPEVLEMQLPFLSKVRKVGRELLVGFPLHGAVGPSM